MDYGHSTKECVSKAGMKAGDATKVAKCVANNALSSKLVQEMEAKTNGIHEVPTIDLGGQRWNGNWQPISNLINAICSAYTGPKKPEACNSNKEHSGRPTCKLPESHH
eukprot:TRINITY_DN67636_c7_g1_i1.p3 TRINITY_DN67636_c7_g1~~TRINITY_DN67636_c7_g1_i1.p3  ORF type:complete len:108 (+),score=24.45 TRINITY_DN67636_c7_g1_i1:349-672(+)